MTTTEPTVEDCLKQLLEMFPGKFISLVRRNEYYPGDLDSGPEETASSVTVKIGNLRTEPKFTGPTLSEAMSEVRKWKES